jgi:signal transduction histidine kinase
MARVLGEGLGATRARVWLRIGDDLRPVATWPADADPDAPDDARVDVRHRGELLGAISVRVPANDPMDPSKRKLMADVAAQAGLVLRNVRLVEELRASRRRLASAQNEQRRRLERSIHDGAQQRLVALGVKARDARRLTSTDAGTAAALLEGVEADAQRALEELRDVARGIYPPLLADKGLAAALKAQAAKSSIAVDVEADGIGRYPEPVEAAVYFSVLEALHNATRHAGATRIDVRLDASPSALAFTVRDDGRGFDPATTGYGTGLQGVEDRLAALDGSLRLESADGAGTAVSGELPLDGDAPAATVGAQSPSSAGNAPS